MGLGKKIKRARDKVIAAIAMKIVKNKMKKPFKK